MKRWGKSHSSWLLLSLSLLVTVGRHETMPLVLTVYCLRESPVDVNHWRWSSQREIVRNRSFFHSTFSHTVMLATQAQETCTRNLHKMFDASSSQFLAPKQLSGQSRCTVRVTCRTVSVLIVCKKLVPEKKLVPDWPTLVQVSGASWACVAGIKIVFHLGRCTSWVGDRLHLLLSVWWCRLKWWC